MEQVEAVMVVFKVAQTAAGTGETAPRVREGPRRIRATFRADMEFREPRRWTRTTKLLNSNSLMGTNNRFELVFELFKTFITISKLRLSDLQLRSLLISPPLHLRTIWSYLFGGTILRGVSD
jgi:hypothetical protein